MTSIGSPTEASNSRQNYFHFILNSLKLLVGQIAFEKFFFQLSKMQSIKKLYEWKSAATIEEKNSREIALSRIFEFHQNMKTNFQYFDLNASSNHHSFFLSLNHLGLKTLPTFFDFKMITHLNLDGNSIEDLETLKNLETLRYLSLKGAIKLDRLDLLDFKDLKHINLQDNNLEDLKEIHLPDNSNLEILLDGNLIRDLPENWIYRDKTSQISLKNNPINIEAKRNFFQKLWERSGPKIICEIDKSNQAPNICKKNRILKRIPYFEDACTIIDLQNRQIELIEDDIFKCPSIYVLDMRNNPLDYETKSKIKKQQRDAAKVHLFAIPLILFDRAYKKKQTELPENIEDCLNLYRAQLQRDLVSNLESS